MNNPHLMFLLLVLVQLSLELPDLLFALLQGQGLLLLLDLAFLLLPLELKINEV